MKQIYDIHCSQLSRPMVCAGSLRFDLPPQETNAAAKEGTACGELLELKLTGQAIGTHAKNGVLFDDDMHFYTEAFANEITGGTHHEGYHPLVLCETKIDWVTRSGIWIKGKYDISYVKEGKLYIDDLKYGWNIVDVKENWQLLGYAIGECIRRNTAFERIVLRIHQPRPHHEDGPTREWEISYEQLLEYKEQIEVRMDQIAGGLAELTTSEKCKYCPAAAEACTAFNRAVFSGIDYVLNEFYQDSVSEKELSFQLDLMSRVMDVLKIKNESLSQLAVSRLKDGKIIPGYGSEPSYGDRQWKDGVSPEVIEVLTGKKIVQEKMLSPAQAEKLGVPKDLVKDFVDRKFIGNKLKKKDFNKLGDQIFGTKGETV